MFIRLLKNFRVLNKNSIRWAMTEAATNYKLSEVEGDLFSAPKTHSLAHCVCWKPTYETLSASLCAMREHMVSYP